MTSIAETPTFETLIERAVSRALQAHQPAADLPEVLTTAEAAALLRVSENTVLVWAKAGAIPGKLLEGRWRFTRRSLLAHIDSAAQNAQVGAA